MMKKKIIKWIMEASIFILFLPFVWPGILFRGLSGRWGKEDKNLMLD
jgi:hypothetical protein